MTERELVQVFGAVAENISTRYGQERRYYDEHRKVFVESCSPLRPLEPRYDEQIDRWLRLLGGKQAETLLDWCATITLTDLPTASMYFCGCQDAGKSLFAAGVARLYSVEGPARYENIIGRFNDELLRTPIVAAEEGLGRGDQDRLKDVIGRELQVIDKKFEPLVHIHGSIRLIINENENRFLMGAEAGEYTKQALAQRIVFVDVGPEPRDYLKSIGGRKGTAEWVTGDLIARHCLWLRDNRKVQHGARFVVEGSWSEAIDQIGGAELEKQRLLKFVVKQTSDCEAMKRGEDGMLYFNVGKLLAALNAEPGRKLTMKALSTCLNDLGAAANARRPDAKGDSNRYRAVSRDALELE